MTSDPRSSLRFAPRGMFGRYQRATQVGSVLALLLIVPRGDQMDRRSLKFSV